MKHKIEVIEEDIKLTQSFSASVKTANNKNINELKSIVNDLKKTQKNSTKQMVNLAKKSTNKGTLEKMASNQKKMNKNQFVLKLKSIKILNL